MTPEEARAALNALIKAGYVTDVVCNTHEGLALTEEEDQEFMDGFDPCVSAVRVWMDKLDPPAPQEQPEAEESRPRLRAVPSST